MTEDKLEALIKEIDPILKKHKLEGVMFMVGVPVGEVVDEACLIAGEENYLVQLLGNSVIRNQKLHRVIDQVAIAVAIHKDNVN